MKQIIQNYRTGDLELAEVPIPLCSSNTILVRNVASLVSMGTERSIIELGQKSLLGKAKARPDLVKRFMDKAKKEGLFKTFQQALARLDNPTPLGYSSAGVVFEAGANVHKFSPGDKVACIGAGYASHAEYITVPGNLCCKIPDSLNFEEASFGMLGIIALHGVRCAKLTFGASIAVVGLGLLGLLTVQILKAYGCRVIGTDIDRAKLDLAKKLGADILAESSKLKAQSELFTDGHGVDAVILTVATKSDEPVNTAVDIARYGGKVVVVGVADIHPQRNEMWHKEVEFIVSKAGGPGTFDPFYENKGIDYPIGYIRWTENRNLEEFLNLVAERKVNVAPLISHRFKIDRAEDVYRDIMENRGGPYIGVVLEYQGDEALRVNGYKLFKRTVSLKTDQRITNNRTQANLGVIGAGLFGKSVLLPVLKKIPDINLDTIATSSSANTYHTAKKFGFEKCTTDYKEILGDDNINSVVILTPHSLHARMVIEALEAGKHVFVEKPLCINESELKDIINSFNKINQSLHLVVGYNRRFSSLANKAKVVFKNRIDPIVITYRINAGFVPPDHWVHSPEEGGSRIIGEVCHFIDLIQYIIGSNPKEVFAYRVSGNNKTCVNNDNVSINLKFDDGSIASIIYTGCGDKAFSKERVEMFCEGISALLDDFRKLTIYKNGRKKKIKLPNQNMGYKAELKHFINMIKVNEEPKLKPEEIFFSTLTVFKINESLQKNTPICIKF